MRKSFLVSTFHISNDQISEKDITIVKRLGAGASSVVFKGFLFRENRFVAVKKINVFERVSTINLVC
jgi:hypothetical protein